MSDLYWQWIFGGVLVLIYAVKRFNTPPSNRLSTTTERYYFSLLLYLLALWLLFLLVGGTLANSPELVKIFFGVDMNETAEKLSGPLYSALLMTTLLPNTRLSKFDQWLREASWDIGNIPIAARRLGSQLRRSRLSVPVVFRDAVKERLAGFDEDATLFGEVHQNLADLIHAPHWIPDSICKFSVLQYSMFDDYFPDRQ